MSSTCNEILTGNLIAQMRRTTPNRYLTRVRRWHRWLLPLSPAWGKRPCLSSRLRPRICTTSMLVATYIASLADSQPPCPGAAASVCPPSQRLFGCQQKQPESTFGGQRYRHQEDSRSLDLSRGKRIRTDPGGGGPPRVLPVSFRGRPKWHCCLIYPRDLFFCDMYSKELNRANAKTDETTNVSAENHNTQQATRVH